MSAISAAAAGLNDALVRFAGASQRVAQSTTDPDVDAAKAVADMIVAETQAKATKSTVNIADEMMRALLEMQREDRA